MTIETVVSASDETAELDPIQPSPAPLAPPLHSVEVVPEPPRRRSSTEVAAMIAAEGRFQAIDPAHIESILDLGYPTA